MLDGEGNVILCKCGKPAGSGIGGKEAYSVWCSDCSPLSKEAVKEGDFVKWISIKERLPDLEWSEPDQEGKKSWAPQQVLLLRKLKYCNGETRQVCSVGEYDTTGIPSVWRTWHEYVDEEGCDDTDGRVVDDVTHWMPLPAPPTEDAPPKQDYDEIISDYASEPTTQIRKNGKRK
jgi:hypothetical protein